jgi:putative endonuclease
VAHGGYVYIMTNNHHTTLYVGVTSNLAARVSEHREKHYPKSFTSRYNLTKIIYYRFLDSIEAAIEEEKRIKAGSRMAKIKLVESMNPRWADLYDEVQDMD